jgi:uncharacterized DUF497 family protein
VEIHQAAYKHGVDEDSIEHALAHAVAVVDLQPEADPPRVLVIGPDRGGNLLEIIWLDLDDERLVIHAMKLRPTFYALLPGGEDS